MTQECETRRALCGISRNEIAIRHAKERASERAAHADGRGRTCEKKVIHLRRRRRNGEAGQFARLEPRPRGRRRRTAKLSCCRNFDLIFRLGRNDDDGDGASRSAFPHAMRPSTPAELSGYADTPRINLGRLTVLGLLGNWQSSNPYRSLSGILDRTAAPLSGHVSCPESFSRSTSTSAAAAAATLYLLVRI